MRGRPFIAVAACVVAVGGVVAQPTAAPGRTPGQFPPPADSGYPLPSVPSVSSLPDRPPPPPAPLFDRPFPADSPVADRREYPAERFYLHLGVLLGWMDRSPLPSGWTVPATGATATFPPGHRSAANAGLVLDGGWWFDRQQTLGVDASYLSLDDGFRRRDPAIVYTPVARYHAATADVFSRFDTADVNLRVQVYAADEFRVDGLIGYRYAGLRERGWVQSIRPDRDVGIVEYRDRATARTDFHGGQVGLAARWQFDRWSFEGTGKVALGGVRARADLTGDSSDTLFAAGGAVPHLSETRFAVLPSASAVLSRQLWGNSRVFVGYTFQYLSRTVRASQVFDAVADPAGSPLGARGSYWMQGLTLGWEWRF